MFDALGEIIFTGDTVHPITLSPEQLRLANEVYQTAVDASVQAMKERIQILNEGRPKTFDSESERLMFDAMIRREVENR